MNVREDHFFYLQYISVFYKGRYKWGLSVLQNQKSIFLIFEYKNTQQSVSENQLTAPFSLYVLGGLSFQSIQYLRLLTGSLSQLKWQGKIHRIEIHRKDNSAGAKPWWRIGSDGFSSV